MGGMHEIAASMIRHKTASFCGRKARDAVPPSAIPSRQTFCPSWTSSSFVHPDKGKGDWLDKVIAAGRAREAEAERERGIEALRRGIREARSGAAVDDGWGDFGEAPADGDASGSPSQPVDAVEDEGSEEEERRAEEKFQNTQNILSFRVMEVERELKTLLRRRHDLQDSVMGRVRLKGEKRGKQYLRDTKASALKRSDPTRPSRSGPGVPASMPRRGRRQTVHRLRDAADVAKAPRSPSSPGSKWRSSRDMEDELMKFELELRSAEEDVRASVLTLREKRSRLAERSHELVRANRATNLLRGLVRRIMRHTCAEEEEERWRGRAVRAGGAGADCGRDAAEFRASSTGGTSPRRARATRKRRPARARRPGPARARRPALARRPARGPRPAWGPSPRGGLPVLVRSARVGRRSRRRRDGGCCGGDRVRRGDEPALDERALGLTSRPRPGPGRDGSMVDFPPSYAPPGVW